MAEGDDEWAKVRDMVRNAPPGTAQTQWNPHELAEEPPQRTFPKKALWLLLLLAIAGGGYYAFDQRDRLLGATEPAPRDSSKSTGPESPTPTAVASAPAAAVPAKSSETKPVSIRKGVKSINVRASPSAASAVVGRLSGGDRAEKIAANDGWARLRFQVGGKSTEGWVRADLLAE